MCSTHQIIRSRKLATLHKSTWACFLPLHPSNRTYHCVEYSGSSYWSGHAYSLTHADAQLAMCRVFCCMQSSWALFSDAICCAASFPGSSHSTYEPGNEAILCSMPKKFKGVNTKAEAARERKQTAKTAADEKKRQEEEDEYWRDDDKHVARKEQRKVATIQLNYSLPSATSYSHSVPIHCEVSLISVGFIPLMHSQHTG